MLTVSLHGVKVVAPIGLYPQEKIMPNTFEVDVDVWVHTEPGEPWPFVDYAIINDVILSVFTPDVQLLEELAQHIHHRIKLQFEDMVQKIKVCVRKLHPPFSNEVAFSQVCWEG